ncbi:hypothetical protein RN001_000175 [Aquatica leii]|uniref:Uncharacterized protein n=1 Tax=Aquatica leii TaxID=1421715 RepID=A0AAN7SKD4_9COLE|nr:hypothetical protein RN001_000175 [Aquatica leii]
MYIIRLLITKTRGPPIATSHTGLSVARYAAGFYSFKKKDDSITGTVTPDKRGKHTNRPFVILDSVKQEVREHINLFPKVPSHYCREKTNKLYVEDGLTISKMYRLYTTWANEKQLISLATERQYRDIFNTEFNIGFFKPKKDRCDICADFKLKPEKNCRDY